MLKQNPLTTQTTNTTINPNRPNERNTNMKFPRTPHLPGSRGTTDDLHTTYTYPGPVVLTEKLDGSNIMMNNKKFITRKGSTSSATWTWPMREIHQLHSTMIPEGHWIAGEFLYWTKTIPYNNLPYPYIAFGAIKGNKVLPFQEAQDLAAHARLPFARVIETFDNGLPANFSPEQYLQEGTEGFVIRPLESFPLPRYGEYVAKFVRSDFVSTATSQGTNTFLSTPQDIPDR